MRHRAWRHAAAAAQARWSLGAAHKTTALTARRARPVLGIGMYPASTAVVSAPSAPT
ncbi:amino acid transporter [Xanthomonas oryzae pv. oryzae]|nr:amino acid transporter [Xanthomonas oryzae pv. oryzae]QBO04470.1 amino acid transporter [Xanthomonas oryzae pv. oryzae]